MLFFPIFKKVCHENNYPFQNKDIVSILDKAIDTPWISTGMLSSNDKKILKYKKKIIKKTLSPYARVRFFNIDHLTMLHKIISKTPLKLLSLILKATFPFRFLYFGNPTDAALGSILSEDKFIFSGKNLAKQVKDTNSGFSYCLPLTRMDKASCQSMVNIIEAVSRKHQLDPSITLNPINSSTIEAVVSLSYNKFNAEKAHQCIREMQEELNAEGHYSYRTNIRDMDLYTDTSSAYYKYLKELKKSFDPHGIISPGRYIT